MTTRDSRTGPRGNILKRPYESPRLVEWGSVIDLTRGALQPPKDFPKVGGTAHT